MKLRPVDDRLLVKPLAPENRTAAGIYLPDTAKEKPQQGVIVAVGTDEELRKLFKEGQQVLFTKYGGSEVRVDGVDHLILQRSDVLAVVEEG